MEIILEYLDLIDFKSRNNFLFKGVNLIGISQNKLSKILETSPDNTGDSVLYEDGDVQTPLEFNSLGLLAWISNDILVSATVSDN